MTAKIYLSVEAPGQHLVLDGHLALLSELLEALRDRRPAAKEHQRGKSSQQQPQVEAKEVRHEP